MNAQENKQLIMAGYRLFQSGDIRALMERYHDDAEMVGPENDMVPFSGSFHGKADIMQFFGKLDAAVQAVHFHPRNMIAEDDKVVVSGDSTWMAKHTSRSYDSSWVHVFTIRDGKIARFEAYYDTAVAAKALHPELAVQQAAGPRLHH